MKSRNQNNKAVVQSWVDAYNNRDAKAAASLYHHKAVNLQVAIGIPLIGRKAIYEQLVEFFKAIPDNFTKIENLFEDKNWVILEWTGGGTFHRSSKSKGKAFQFEGCGLFKIKNQKIIFQRGYWDMKKWEKVTGTK
jgi:steroid delta-isomerase-like uncharacterized protein